jgi:hypothetical protein
MPVWPGTVAAGRKPNRLLTGNPLLLKIQAKTYPHEAICKVNSPNIFFMKHFSRVAYSTLN